MGYLAVCCCGNAWIADSYGLVNLDDTSDVVILVETSRSSGIVLLRNNWYKQAGIGRFSCSAREPASG